MDKSLALAEALAQLQNMTKRAAAPALPQTPITSGRAEKVFAPNMRGDLVEVGTVYSFGKEA